MRPPVSGGRSAGRGPASDRAMRDQRLPWLGAGRRQRHRERADHVLDPHAVRVHDDDGRRVAGDERVPAPALGAFDATRGSGPGPSPARAGKSPTGVETSASSSVQTGTMGHALASASNSFRLGLICSCGSTCAPSPRCRSDRPGAGGHGDGKQETPDRRPGAAGARGASAGPTSASAPGSASPRATSRSSRASASGADCACWAATSSTARDAGAAILWNPCACPSCSCRRCARTRRRPRSRAIASCSAAGSCGR